MYGAPVFHQIRTPFIQGDASVQQGLSAAFGFVAHDWHRGAADKRYSLAIQPAPPGLRAEETCVPLDVPLRSTPHMTGKPLVPFGPVR